MNINCNPEIDHKFVVYCHLNKLNGRRYIGWPKDF